MWRSTLAVLATVALTAFPVSDAQAQSGEEHPIVGVWSLNLNRSSFEPGPGPQSLTRRFGIDDEGYLVSVRATITPAGVPTFAMARARLDGDDYAVWTDGGLYGFLADGTTPPNTAAFEQVSPSTLRLTQKNAEGVVGPLSPNTWEVSEDGNTLTVTTTGTNQNGDEVRNVEVYDRVRN